jgi:uncharacterized damage-inducible protein DinB
MTPAACEAFLTFSRRKTLELLDAIAGRPDADKLLAWRPGPGRAHVAWQLMHIAATDDRHLYVRMRGAAEPREPEYVRRFAGGSTPDDTIPAVAEIRRYLTERRQEMLDHLRTLTEAQMPTKPRPEAPWTYAEWFQVLSWHEAHHQGQVHLTVNLYKVAHP